MREFKTVEWAHSTNIYELNVRQYTPEGTFAAFSKHLPRLKEMGVKTLWFMPLTPISEKNKKGSLGSYYACSDYTSINPEFGTMVDFKTLVDLAKKKDFKIIIDWVANHTGWDHSWTKDHPEYYLIDPATNDFKMASGMEDIIELDFNNLAMRRAMIDAMKFWVKEFDIDGFRCDLAFWVVLDFWKQARKELEQLKPLFWLGEFDELDHPSYGEVFDASYSWTWMHMTKDFYKNDLALDSLYGVLKNYDDLGDSTMRTWFTSNHDENSWNGTEYEKYGAMAKALAVFSFTWNGIPLIYSGQEMPNKKRIKFFDKDELEWDEENNPVAIGLHRFYKTLLELKNNNTALRTGDRSIQTFRIKTSADKKIFAFLRKSDTDEVLVILNLSSEDLNIEILDERIRNSYKEIFTGGYYSNKPDILSWDYLVFENV